MEHMDRFSLIVVTDETSPIRRFDVQRRTLRRALWGAGLAAFLLLVALVDYVRVRVEHVELGRLRIENAEQRARIDSFDQSVAEVQSTLTRVQEFERKVRLIANLPGSAASGGTDVVEVGPVDEGDLAGEGGEEVEAVPPAAALSAPEAEASSAALRAAGKLRAELGGDPLALLRGEVARLSALARDRQLSLAELVEQLEDKHQHLASSPAIWPTQGWLTSRFGTRISPFTGKRQFHAGIDIAGEPGMAVLATARGRVVFTGSKGPLGQTVILDHGHGVRTHYGHNQVLHVKAGDVVDRGQQIASLGNTGRSTGPHLHYSVEIHGKAVNPLDYIFD
jgi:murein DD-endopeptidase MepM/ murein hydrolase activator NlpD